MNQVIDILNPEKPKRVAIVASNPSISKQTGWLLVGRIDPPLLRVHQARVCGGHF